MNMDLLINLLSAMMVAVGALLIFANIFVIIATLLHRRHSAMRMLAPFARAVTMLRLGDSYSPSRPYDPR